MKLLDLIIHWFSDSYLCVKWNSSWSRVFKVCFSIRQGSVLSQYLFTNVEVVQACREVFHCELPSVQLTERYKKFIGLNDHCDYLQ